MKPQLNKPINSSKHVIALIMSLFFAFGFCTVLVDTLIPKLKDLFALSYNEVMLTQFCFFGAYFIISIPASKLINRIGYFQSVTLGLVIMALGCWSFTPAAQHGSYPAFLLALFILASGVTIVQVAVNPLTTIVGNPQQAHSRLTLAQAFNSLATAIGPLFGAFFILKGALITPDARLLSPEALIALRQSEGHAVQLPFISIGIVLVLLAVICWFCRNWAPSPNNVLDTSTYKQLIKKPRLMLGTFAIFLYVGAEVSIGSAMANYLIQPSVLGASPQKAGSMVALYWGMAMVGRFFGAAILKRVNPSLLLSVFALGAAGLVGISALSNGYVAAYSLLAVGFCNSIMFPTIFSLSVEGLNNEAPKASGLLCLAIVGGAIVPLITGAIADLSGLSIALLVPIFCYFYIAFFGKFTLQSVTH